MLCSVWAKFHGSFGFNFLHPEDQFEIKQEKRIATDVAYNTMINDFITQLHISAEMKPRLLTAVTERESYSNYLRRQSTQENNHRSWNKLLIHTASTRFKDWKDTPTVTVIYDKTGLAEMENSAKMAFIRDKMSERDSEGHLKHDNWVEYSK